MSYTIAPPAQLLERAPDAIYREIGEAWIALEEQYAALGRSIAERRRMRGWSQEQLGRLAGISRDMVALYELGQRWREDAPGIERIVLVLTAGRRFAPMASRRGGKRRQARAPAS